MRKLVITELAKKDLISLDKAIQKRVQSALDKMMDDPKSVTIKKLEGEPEEWSLRVGNWRVILYFDWDERVVYVDRIKHRGKVYLNCGTDKQHIQAVIEKIYLDEVVKVTEFVAR